MEESGSSPHTRGLRGRGFQESVSYGIIPAYAGPTSTTETGLRSCWDHPRIRGAYRDCILLFNCLEGSSPHTRGLPRLDSSEDIRVRIIPAYAGPTPF